MLSHPSFDSANGTYNIVAAKKWWHFYLQRDSWIHEVDSATIWVVVCINVVRKKATVVPCSNQQVLSSKLVMRNYQLLRDRNCSLISCILSGRFFLCFNWLWSSCTKSTSSQTSECTKIPSWESLECLCYVWWYQCCQQFETNFFHFYVVRQ